MEKLLGAFIFLKARFGEPSTQAALSSICTTIGIQYPATLIGNIFTLGAVAFGTLGFWFKEGKAETIIK